MRKPFLQATVRLTTPMFGAGAAAGRVDSDRPINAKSVRGHLRFWWRSLHAHAYPTLRELYADEAAIWGEATTDTYGAPSAVEVAVNVTAAGEPFDPGTIREPKGPPYALWPFFPKKDRAVLTGLNKVAFTVSLSWAPHASFGLRPQFQAEATAALRAWIAFGGVGARTRRGCGSLVSDALEPGQWLPSLPGYLHDFQPRCGATSAPDGAYAHPIPMLKGAKLLRGDTRPHTDAWGEAIVRMRHFRQGVNFARNPGAPDPRKPGRSRWPEADALRSLPGAGPTKYTPRHPAGHYFPRADLGLPIIFSSMEPEAELFAAGKGATRMASPFILKPLAADERKSAPIVLLLSAPHVWDTGTPGVKLKVLGSELPIATTELYDASKVNVIGTTATGTARDQFVAQVASVWKTAVQTL